MEREKKYAEIFKDDVLAELFPRTKSDNFFELLYGDAEEGAYDIGVSFDSCSSGALHFFFNLRRRPGKCLACNLTFGLPAVFVRHPALDVQGLVEKLDGLLDGKAKILGWRLGDTVERSPDLHVIPLQISIEEN